MDEDTQTNHVNGDIPLLQKDSSRDIHMQSPVLPPSPISRPMTPSRKRPRLATWNAPSYVPDFLPPFPTTNVTVNGPSSRDGTPQPIIKQEAEVATPSTTEMAERDRLQTVLPQQLATNASASDYLTPVPYNMSSLSSTLETHLPDKHLWRRSVDDAGTALQLQPRKHQIPDVTPALMSAYHHLLVNPSPKTPSTNPNRHRVALTMMHQAYTSPRWMHSDSLFADVSPPRPRVVAPGPTYPVIIGAKKEDHVPLLPWAPKTITPLETLVPLISQHRSRIPTISKMTLPVSNLVTIP